MQTTLNGINQKLYVDTAFNTQCTVFHFNKCKLRNILQNSLYTDSSLPFRGFAVYMCSCLLMFIAAGQFTERGYTCLSAHILRDRNYFRKTYILHAQDDVPCDFYCVELAKFRLNLSFELLFLHTHTFLGNVMNLWKSFLLFLYIGLIWMGQWSLLTPLSRTWKRPSTPSRASWITCTTGRR